MSNSKPSEQTGKKISKAPRKPQVVKKRPSYDMTKPGDNDYDEARRAAADLCRLAGMWCTIADEYAEAMRPAFIAMNDDDPPITDPAVIRKKQAERRQEVLGLVRDHWQAWEAAMGRVRLAISKIKDPELGPARVAAKMAMAELFRIFFPAIILSPNEKPGDQLLRAGGPLFWRKDASALRSELDRVLKPLADFSDLMIMYDPSPVSMFARAIDRDSGWTVQLLCKEIGRSKSVLSVWRRSAQPPVPGRVRAETFLFEELQRLTEAAEAHGDMDSAGKLREIVQSQRKPKAP